MTLSGDEQEWYKQTASIDFLHHQIKQQKRAGDQEANESNQQKQIYWQSTFDTLLTHKKTLKQEHMLKHKLALTLFSI